MCTLTFTEVNEWAKRENNSFSKREKTVTKQLPIWVENRLAEHLLTQMGG